MSTIIRQTQQTPALRHGLEQPTAPGALGVNFRTPAAHRCGGPRTVATSVSRPVAVCVVAAAVDAENNGGDLKSEDDFVSPTCLLPSLMEIFSTSIPTVKRIPQKCRVTVAKAYTQR